MDLSSYPTELLEAFLPAIKAELSRRKKLCRASKRSSFASSLKPSRCQSRDEINSHIFAENSSSLKSLRGHDRPISERAKYFSALICQDWSHLYPESDSSEKYYVYVHVDPRKRVFVAPKSCGGNYKGEPFYIGKGTASRAYDLKRNQGHGKIIKQILDDGFKPEDIVHIAFDGLTESKAFELEAKLIYFFKTVYEDPKNGILVNLDIGKRPHFSGVMSKYFTRRMAEAASS